MYHPAVNVLSKHIKFITIFPMNFFNFNAKIISVYCNGQILVMTGAVRHLVENDA